VTTHAFSAPSSRNAPCPCGSGRRYKECHGAPNRPAPSSRPLPELLQAALAAQVRGRLDEARDLYEQALVLDPQHFDALHMLGVVHYQKCEYEEARSWIARACALRPYIVDAWRNLRLADNAIRRMRGGDQYRSWLAGREQAENEALAHSRTEIGTRSNAPRIAIALPTYNPPERWLTRCLDSVLAQTYPHWELCIADDASSDDSTRRVIAAYAAREPRIRVALRERNGRIAAASNSAVALATAPFVALLDHDDELPPCALADVALEIAAHPHAVLIYSDEDKIDERGRRFDPYFKPDWNPVLMRSQNAVSHLGVYRRDILSDIGGFRDGFEGAQDWDLALRVAERVEARDIRHIPRVLYHWRAIATSTARGMGAKGYAAAAQERVVVEHCARQGAAVAIRRVSHGTFLQSDPVGDTEAAATLVVLRPPWVPRAGLEPRWRERSGAAVREVMIVDVDNGSDPTEGVDERPLRLDPAGPRALNAAAHDAHGEIVVFVDGELDPVTLDWLDLLVRHARMSGGAVGGLTLDAQRCIAGAGFVLDPVAIAASPYVGEAEGHVSMGGRSLIVQNLAAVRLECLAVHKSAWNTTGGLDESSLRRTFHDVDWCLRAARAGLRHVWHPGVVLAYPRPLRVDYATGLLRVEDAEDAATMRGRWGEALARDAAYNPNLDRPPRLFELMGPNIGATP
jgi:GT2 family glycosyltransferase